MKFERLLIGYRRLRARLWWEQHWRDANFQPPWLRQAPQPFVLTGFEAGWLSPGMNALDIGCGAGHTAAWLAARGINVVAVDFARHMIAQAKSRFGDRPALTFKVMDVCGPDLLNITFDVLIDAGCLHTIASALRRQYLQNVLRWSRRGSRLVVTMHSRRKSTQERRAELEALFGPAFELVQYEEIPSFEANRVNPVFHLIRTGTGERRQSLERLAEHQKGEIVTMRKLGGGFRTILVQKGSFSAEYELDLYLGFRSGDCDRLRSSL